MKTTIYPLNKYKVFDSAYWGIGACSNGLIYFGLCTHIPGKSAGFFSFDPKTEHITHLWDMAEILPSDKPSQLHGKIHTPILEGDDAMLYFGTHFAYPYGEPGEVEYEGGHLMRYDPARNKMTSLGIPSAHEGIITVSLDVQHMQAYVLTIPSGHLIRCDIAAGTFHHIGTVPSKGSICRAITIDAQGDVYGSYEDNGMFVYDRSQDALVFYDDFFPLQKTVEWQSKSRGGVNKIGRALWRCIAYDPVSNKLHGILAAGSQRFTIDCATKTLQIEQPFVPEELLEQANEIYPTLSLALRDGQLTYAPASGLFDYCRSEGISGWSHLMTTDIHTGVTSDLGPITDVADAQRVYGVGGAVATENCIYLLGATESTYNGLEKITKEESLFYLQEKPFNVSFIRISL